MLAMPSTIPITRMGMALSLGMAAFLSVICFVPSSHHQLCCSPAQHRQVIAAMQDNQVPLLQHSCTT